MKTQPNKLRNAKYFRLKCRIRARLFQYDEKSEDLYDKAIRVLRKAVRLEIASREYPETDRWGATNEDRRSLARHGVCWGD